MIDRYFASFVCGTYLLFTAILSINIFIGLISNALQTEAFSTVEAQFLLGRIEVILNYEWRLSDRKRLALQEIIHRQCAPLQLNWKEINFNAYGQSRDEQQTKAFAGFRQTLDKSHVQLDTFRAQMQQKLTEIDSSLYKLHAEKSVQKSTPTSPDVIIQRPQPTVPPPSGSRGATIPPRIDLSNVRPAQPIPIIREPNDHMMVLDELARLRSLLEDTLARQSERGAQTTRALPGSTSSTSPSHTTTGAVAGTRHPPSQQFDRSPLIVHHDTHGVLHSNDLNERMTDLQLAVNRLHQDVGAIRQVLERISPLSTSLILGRSIGRR